MNRIASVLGTSRRALLLDNKMRATSNPLFTAGTALVQSAASVQGTKSVFTPRSISSHRGSEEGSNKAAVRLLGRQPKAHLLHVAVARQQRGLP